MQVGPATARQQLATFLVGATLLAMLAAASVVGVGAAALAHADTKHLRREQAHARHSISHAKASLDESSHQTRRAFSALTRSRAALRSARDNLQAARSHLLRARGRDRQARAELARARARLADAQSSLALGQQAVVDQHTQLVRDVVSTYEGGDPQLIGFLSLLGSATPADLTAKQANNELVLSSEDRTLDGFKASRVLLQVRTDELTQARNLVAMKQTQAHATLLRKRQFKLQAVAAKLRMVRVVHQRHHAWTLGRKARAHDRALLARSQAQAGRIHRQLMAEIAREHRHGGGYTGPTGGLLMRPVNGPITSPYGYRINPIGHYWGLHDGDDFGAACGTPIWAAGNGTVLSEYYSSVWGNRLFINLGLINGKNVTVIYNHLSAYRSHVGQHVGRGQVVGLIGTTGWSTGCHTHFTVMVNGTAVDPTPWIS